MKRIYLIGYMGAGKTSVGRILAQRMNLMFIDLDQYIENRFHRTVPQLFVEKGESGFRTLEQHMLAEVSDFEDVLISTGGGTPCFFDNMEQMKQHGTIVYLHVSVEELVKRLMLHQNTRPLLKDMSREEMTAFVADALEKRDSYYRQADITFDAELMDTEQETHVAAESLEKILNRS